MTLKGKIQNYDETIFEDKWPKVRLCIQNRIMLWSVTRRRSVLIGKFQLEGIACSLAFEWSEFKMQFRKYELRSHQSILSLKNSHNLDLNLTNTYKFNKYLFYF